MARLTRARWVPQSPGPSDPKGAHKSLAHKGPGEHTRVRRARAKGAHKGLCPQVSTEETEKQLDEYACFGITRRHVHLHIRKPFTLISYFDPFNLGQHDSAVTTPENT